MDGKQLKALIKLLKKLKKDATPGPWTWDGMKIKKDHIWVPECATFGDTMIQLTDNYENHGPDCLLLQTLRNNLDPIIDALEREEQYGAIIDSMPL